MRLTAFRCAPFSFYCHRMQLLQASTCICMSSLLYQGARLLFFVRVRLF